MTSTETNPFDEWEDAFWRYAKSRNCPIIDLTEGDMSLAKMCVAVRTSEALKANFTDRWHGTHLKSDDKAQREVGGVLGEIAVMRWLGLPTKLTVNTFHRKADVGEDIEVRTVLQPDYALTIRTNDNPDRRFILVVLWKTQAVLIGWIFGRDAMVDANKRNPNNQGAAWFVPQRKLLTMDNFERGNNE